MANFGIELTRGQLNYLLGPASGNNVLIGLVFKLKELVDGAPVEFGVRRAIRILNANSDIVEFSGETIVSGEVYRESGNNLEPTGSPNYTAGDEIQFNGSTPDANFWYFSADAVDTLLAVSNKVIVSGSGYQPGTWAYPPNNVGNKYGSLKMEVNRTDLRINPGNKDNQIPAAIAAHPCPPNWKPFQ